MGILPKNIAPWYWVLLQILMLAPIVLLSIDLVTNTIAYSQPIEPQPDVKYEDGYGLFAPIFYMFGLTGSALAPILIVLDFVFIIGETSVLFFLVFVTRYLFKQRWWAVVFSIFISSVWISYYFPLEERYPFLIMLPIFILIVSLITLIKIFIIAREQKNVQQTEF